MCVHGVILLTTYSAFHGAPSHQLSVLLLQSFHYSSAHWLFKNTYVFHRSVALFFWLFLRGICFLYILASEGMGRLPSAFMAPQHWTSACMVSLSCCHVGILCRDAQKGMLGTEQHIGTKSTEPEALRVVQPGLVLPKGLLFWIFKGRYFQPKLQFSRSCWLSFCLALVQRFSEILSMEAGHSSELSCHLCGIPEAFPWVWTVNLLLDYFWLQNDYLRVFTFDVDSMYP